MWHWHHHITSVDFGNISLFARFNAFFYNGGCYSRYLQSCLWFKQLYFFFNVTLCAALIKIMAKSLFWLVKISRKHNFIYYIIYYAHEADKYTLTESNLHILFKKRLNKTRHTLLGLFFYIFIKSVFHLSWAQLGSVSKAKSQTYSD